MVLQSDITTLSNFAHAAHYLSYASQSVSRQTATGMRNDDGPDALDRHDVRDTVTLSRADAEPLRENDETLNATDKEVSPAGKQLTEEEREQVHALKRRDAEVKRHEQAHYRAGGRYASPPSYEYQTGPDGHRYAIGGSVDIDTSEIPGDPEATLEKARVIKRAALAPEEPSTQDRKVAREADRMAAQAQRNILERKKGAHEYEIATTDMPREAVASEEEVSDLDQVATAAVELREHAEEPSELDLAVRPTEQFVQQYRTSRLEQVGELQVIAHRVSKLQEYTQYMHATPKFDLYA